jgi:hypothetical protein
MGNEVFIPYAVFSEGFEDTADGSVTLARIINRVECIENNTNVYNQTSNLPVLKVPYAVCAYSARCE